MTATPPTSKLVTLFKHAIPLVLAALGGILTYIQNNPNYAIYGTVLAVVIHLISEWSVE